MTNRGLDWPSAARVVWSEPLTLHAHNRGSANTGGHYAYETAPGAVFEATVEVKPMCAGDALDFRGFIHGLRGRGGNFFLQAGPARSAPDPCGDLFEGKTHFTDCTEFSDGTTFSENYNGLTARATGTLTGAASAGATQITISGDTDSELLAVGAFMVIGNLEDGGQLVRITAVSGGTVDFIPKLRAAKDSAEAVQIGNVLGLFRLDQETPAIPLDGFKSGPVSIKISEVY